MRPQVLSRAAVEMVLGGKVNRVSEDFEIHFKDRITPLAASDYRTAERVARRLVAQFEHGLTDISLTMDALGVAHGLVCEDVFRPGSVRALFFPATLDKGSGFYRCGMPAAALNRGDRVVATCNLLGPRPPARMALDYDVAVFQLAHDKGTRRIAKELQAMGRKVVYEIDDAIDCMEPWHPGYETYRSPEARAEVFEMMKLADLVTVSTRWLRDRYAKYCRRIDVVPNMVDLGNLPKKAVRDDKLFRVLWAGSPSHAGDLAEVVGALRAFVARHDDVRVVFFGAEPVGHGIAPGKVDVIPWCDFLNYHETLASVGADVALAPLADVPFNYGKSAIRILEYMVAGYPVIASNVGPYELLVNGQSGLLVRNAGDWLVNLEVLHAQKEFREQVVRHGSELVRAYDVAVQAKGIEDLYASLGRGI